MAFNTALSGLRAAQADLGVSGNNIANASTVGFKESRAEFGDLFAAGVTGISSRAVGQGVQMSNVGQQFTQGNISFTDNNLDLAINGNGFFMLDMNGVTQYSRSGIMGVDKDGFVVNNQGARLQGFPATGNGQVGGNVEPLQISTDNRAPSATSEVAMALNMDSEARDLSVGTPAAMPAIDPSDPDTYNHATSTTIYDSLGNSHVLSTYFQKDASSGAANTWTMDLLIDGQEVGGAAGATPATRATFTLTFDNAGKLVDLAAGTAPNATLSIAPINVSNWTPLKTDLLPSVALPNGAAAPAAFSFDLKGTTQFASSFAVNGSSQNGYTTGRLMGVDIDDSGTMLARYSNGQADVIGRVALVNFNNPQGLTPVGDNAWTESFQSGNPIVGSPGTSSLGIIQSGALEDSNVDLSDQLVNLILAQRNYQANAKTIETADSLTQTIINMR